MPSTSQNSAEGSDLGITALAVRIAKWIVTQSQNGIAGPIDQADLQAVIADTEVRELAEAIAKLESEGYLSTSPTITTVLSYMRATLDIFATYDPIAGLGDPVADSLTLIEQVLGGKDSVNVRDLRKQTGWPIRRFNPAAGLVIARVDERRVGQSQNEYPARHFFLMAEDRVAVKRYAASFACKTRRVPFITISHRRRHCSTTLSTRRPRRLVEA